MSITGLLYVARDALNVNQIGIDITGSNIANVNTDGYSRERIVVSATGGDFVRGQLAQVSVSVDKIERQYDRYLEGQIITQRQHIGYSSTLNDRLSSIENIFNEAQAGSLNDLLNGMWSAWDTLSANPTGQVEREAVTAKAQSVAEKLNSFAISLTQLKADIKTTIRDTVTTVNSTLKEIRDLNAQIAEAGLKEGQTNILADKLMGLLGNLAESIGIMWNENSDGTVNVYLPNGTPLVERLSTFELKAEDVGNRMIITSPQVNQGESVNNVITKGKLGALITSQDEIIPRYQALLNTFARSLAEALNAAHTQGVDSDGNQGAYFFMYDAANPAITIKVNPAIAANARLIAASATTEGDGDNAARIAALKDALIMDGGSSTLNTNFAAIVGRIGRQVADSAADLDHQNVIMTNVKNRRESVSGVSIDEEMIALMKYQLSYAAVGRLIKTTSDILDILVNLGE